RSLAGPSRRRAPRVFTATEKSCQSGLLARRAVVRDPRQLALAAGADQGQAARTGASSPAVDGVRVVPAHSALELLARLRIEPPERVVVGRLDLLPGIEPERPEALAAVDVADAGREIGRASCRDRG